MLALSGATLALAACGQGGSSSGKVLRVGSQRGGTKALMGASSALDGATYTVEWAEFPAAQPLLEALGSGAIDLGLAGDAPFQFAYQAGSPIRAIQAQTVINRPPLALGIVVPAASTAQTLADLKGKRVATTRGSIGHYMVLRALVAEKLPPDYVQITFLSPSDSKAALQSGSVAAWGIWVPYISMAIADGYRVLVDGHDLFTAASFDVANVKAVETKADLLKDFLAREGQALLWAKSHSDELAKVLSSETGMPFAIAREMAVRNARTAVPFTDAFIADQQVVVDTFRNAGELKTVRPIKDAFVNLN